MNTYQVIGDGFGGIVTPIKADNFVVDGPVAHFYIGDERVAAVTHWTAILLMANEDETARAFLVGAPA